LVHLYRSCDAFVSPHQNEGFGMKILDALAYKLPTVATAFNSTTDFCTEETSLPVARTPSARTLPDALLVWADERPGLAEPGGKLLLGTYGGRSEAGRARTPTAGRRHGPWSIHMGRRRGGSRSPKWCDRGVRAVAVAAPLPSVHDSSRCARPTGSAPGCRWWYPRSTGRRNSSAASTR
jgi:hypothetical protein